MPHEPKFKTGETTIDIFAASETQCIIVARFRHIFNKYSKCGAYTDSTVFDERDAGHTLYAVYNYKLDGFTWEYESHMEKYCTNCERGKLVLMTKYPMIFERYYIVKKSEFMKNLFGVEYNEETKKVNAIPT